jgi:hypothetical protein
MPFLFGVRLHTRPGLDILASPSETPSIIRRRMIS